MPDEREVRGLLALLLLTDARRATRTDADGRLVLLEDQDRSPWDRAAIDEGRRLVVDAFRTGRVGPVRAAGRHRRAARRRRSYARRPTGAQVLGALRRLLRGVALAGRRAQPGRRGVDGRRAGGRASPRSRRSSADGRLAGYHYLPAVRADLLRRLGRQPEAADAYRAALDLADNDAERSFLAARLAEVGTPRRS